MPTTEYKGYGITHHKDGMFSVSVEYDQANGEKSTACLKGKTLDELHAKIDDFISNCEKLDGEYNDTMTDLAKQINETHSNVLSGIKSIQEKNKATLLDAINCGKLLTKAKKTLAHGKWQTWLNENCKNISPRTDQRYRKLANKYAKASHVTQLDSIRQAYIMFGITAKDTPKKKDAPATTTGTATLNAPAGATTATSTGTATDGLTKADNSTVTVDLSNTAPPLQEIADMLMAHLEQLTDEKAIGDAINILAPVISWANGMAKESVEV